ncbi:uncharacterized protein TNCV_1310621 [Trichonephila clavipes]|nr:uncharacterized protein TNCV_1310621 [Trichonephila clavipes]
MEVKQHNAARHLGPLYQLTGSPYALPVPFIPRFKQGQVYKEWKKRARYPTPILPFSKRPIARPIIPFKICRELGEKITYDSELDELASKMKHGKIPLPLLRFPAAKLMEMRETGYSVELKDYIMEKAAFSLKKFKDKIKDAAVVYARRNIKPMLREGFPTKHERDTFIEIYQRYLPIKVSDMKNYSLWVRPAGYGVSYKGRPLYPDKFAFGRKIDGK